MLQWLRDLAGHLTAAVTGRVYSRRSSRWPAVRAAVLKECPDCSCCGRTGNLIVHHIRPFHLFPELELERSNLQVLCEGRTFNCHLWVGHLGDFQSGWNPDSIEDAARWREKISSRPKRRDETTVK